MKIYSELVEVIVPVTQRWLGRWCSCQIEVGYGTKAVEAAVCNEERSRRNGCRPFFYGEMALTPNEN